MVHPNQGASVFDVLNARLGTYCNAVGQETSDNMLYAAFILLSQVAIPTKSVCGTIADALLGGQAVVLYELASLVNMRIYHRVFTVLVPEVKGAAIITSAALLQIIMYLVGQQPALIDAFGYVWMQKCSGKLALSLVTPLSLSTAA